MSLVLIFLSACSIGIDRILPTPNKLNREVQPEDYQASNSLKGMIKEGPGMFASEKYNRENFEKLLDQFPNNLSGQDIYNRLIYYLAENYEEDIKGMQEVDPVYRTDLTKNLPEDTSGTTQKSNPAPKANVVILLDASGSMRAKLEGKEKMVLAKEAIKNFVSKLPEGTHVSLRVYGHKGSGSNRDKILSCQSSETVYKNRPYHEESFHAALNKFGPSGWTPLAKAIQDAKLDFKDSQTGAKNVVYIVSDGNETCGGDPVKEAKALNESDIQAVINIIGFDVKNQEQQALKAIADAGQGEYINADTPDKLMEEMQKEYTKLWLAWNRWGGSSWVNIQKEWSKKWRKLSSHKRKLDRKLLREKRRLDRAFLYLYRKNKLNDEAYSTVNEMINHRYESINDYYGALYESKDQLLVNTRDEIQDNIKKKQEEMTDKYDIP